MSEEEKVEININENVKKHTHKEKYLSSTPSMNVRKQQEELQMKKESDDIIDPGVTAKTMSSPKKKRIILKNELTAKMPSIMIEALSTTYEDTKKLLYSEAAAMYIQRLWRGRQQRINFLKQINIRKYVGVRTKTMGEATSVVAKKIRERSDECYCCA